MIRTLLLACLGVVACTQHVEPDAYDVAELELADPPQPPTIPTATPQPVAAPTSARPGFEKNVYSADYRDEGWVADVIGTLRGSREDLLAAYDIDEYDFSGEGVVAQPGKPGMPRGWKKGDAWMLVTPDGVIEARAKKYRLESGASELHLVVELGKNAREFDHALAIRGTDVPPGLVFALPQPRDGTALGATEAVRAAVLASTKKGIPRRLFENARIAAKHIAIYDARLPEPWTSVVFVDAPSRHYGEAARASAVLLLAADGTLEHAALPEIETGRMRALAILDLDGNGVDEVFYGDEYDEGAHDLLLWFDGHALKRRVLSGDGA